MKSTNRNGLVLFIFLSTCIGYAAEINEGELIRLIRNLQEQVNQQQKEIQSLRALVENKGVEGIDEMEPVTAQRTFNSLPAVGFPAGSSHDDADLDRIPDSHAAIKETAGVQLGKMIDGLSIKGDLRLRYEAQERTLAGSTVEQSRDRYRVRLRIGGVWHNVDDSWEIGVGLATGSSGPRSSTSTNQSFSNNGVFQSNEINLDYVYARHSWDLEAGELDLVLGQQIHPWEKTTTFMVWDNDVRPVGITGDYKVEGFFIKGGVYDVLGAESASAGGENAEVFMVGGQAGFQFDNDDSGVILAVGYQDYNSQAYEAVNSEVTVDGAALTLTNKADFNLGELFAKIHTKTENTKLSLHGHWVKNFGADDLGGSQGGRGLRAEDEDTAWLVGGTVKWGKTEFGVDYAHIEADSVFAPVKDGAFGDGAGTSITNIEGLRISATYNFTKTMLLQGILMDVEEIERGIGGAAQSSEGDGKLYQLDVVYKF